MEITYKTCLTKEDFKNTKWRVDSKQSEVLQIIAFNFGFDWAMRLDKKISSLDKPFLYFDERDWIQYSTKDYEEEFNSDKQKEMFFNDWVIEEETHSQEEYNEMMKPQPIYYLDDGEIIDQNMLPIKMTIESLEITEMYIRPEDLFTAGMHELADLIGMPMEWRK